MLITVSPTADAERYFDAMEAVGQAHDAWQEAETTRLANAFIDAAEWGPDEPLEGSNVEEARYEVNCRNPELFDALFYWAARQTDNPAVRAMVADIADGWAAMKVEESAARPPEEVRRLLSKHPAHACGSADAI